MPESPLDALPAMLAIKRAIASVDQAITRLPPGRPEMDLLTDALNRLVAAELSLAPRP